MRKKGILLLFLFCLISAVYSQEGQDIRAEEEFWTGAISEDEVYVVSLNSITNVSMQKYMLKGLIVREVVIDTVGNAIARFYHIEPIQGGESSPANQLFQQTQQLVESGIDSTSLTSQAGVDPNKVVIKQYPNTTHAKTIEYRLSSKQTVKLLFNSVRNAWQKKEKAIFRVKS